MDKDFIFVAWFLAKPQTFTNQEVGSRSELVHMGSWPLLCVFHHFLQGIESSVLSRQLSGGAQCVVLAQLFRWFLQGGKSRGLSRDFLPAPAFMNCHKCSWRFVASLQFKNFMNKGSWARWCPFLGSILCLCCKIGIVVWVFRSL